jgi:hypothetical protein
MKKSFANQRTTLRETNRIIGPIEVTHFGEIFTTDFPDATDGKSADSYPCHP